MVKRDKYDKDRGLSFMWLKCCIRQTFYFCKKYIFVKLVIDSVSCTDIIKYALESIRFEKIPGVHQIRREECVYAALRNSR